MFMIFLNFGKQYFLKEGLYPDASYQFGSGADKFIQILANPGPQHWFLTDYFIGD